MFLLDMSDEHFLIGHIVYLDITFQIHPSILRLNQTFSMPTQMANNKNSP